MGPTGLGDRAQLFAAQRHNVTLRERLATLNEEMSTGRAADLARHLDGDTVALADVDRRLGLAESYGRAAAEAANRLAAMQVATGVALSVRGDLAQSLTAVTAVGVELRPEDVASGSVEGRGAFDDLVGTLNTRWGEAALFAGTAVGSAALAGADAMMGSIRTAVAGLATAADVAAALDGWFDDPAGGFATMAYQGTDTDLTRAIDQGSTIALSVRADDPALRGLLKAAAAASLAADPALGLSTAEGAALLEDARDRLYQIAAPLAQVGAELGAAEARAEEAQARHTARSTAYGIVRAEMTGVDPYATATNLEAVQTQLETHYLLTDRLSQLNLATFLR